MTELETKLRLAIDEKTSKIIPENIKKDVQIFDVIGIFEGGTSGPITQEEYDRLIGYADEILEGTNEYIELEYIESTGTQYINLGYTPMLETKLELQISNISSSENLGIVSATTQYANGRRFLLAWWGDRNQFAWSGRDNTLNPTAFGTDEGMNVNTISIYQDTVYFNNTQISANTISSYQDLTEMWILRSAVNERCFSARLHYLKIYENNILIKDLIPVKRISDNVVCMYDKVSGQFFTNAGTGTFIAGPEKEVE